MRKRNMLAVLAAGQLLLAILFGVLTGHFYVTGRETAVLEADLGHQLARSSTEARSFLLHLRRTVPAIRNVGESINTASEEQNRWGDPVIACAGDIDRFTALWLESSRGELGERAARFLLEERPVRRTMLILAAICVGIAVIFLGNSVALWCLFRQTPPPDRQ